MVGTRREPQSLGAFAEEFTTLGREPAVRLEPATGRLAIHPDSRQEAVAIALSLHSRRHPRADRRTRFLALHLPERGQRDRAHANVEVDPVGERAREARAVLQDRGGAAAAPAAPIAVEPAGTGIR